MYSFQSELLLCHFQKDAWLCFIFIVLIQSCWIVKSLKFVLNFVAGIEQRSSSYSEFSETSGFVSLLNSVTHGWWIDHFACLITCFCFLDVPSWPCRTLVIKPYGFLCLLQVVFLELCSSRVAVLTLQNLKVSILFFFFFYVHKCAKCGKIFYS